MKTAARRRSLDTRRILGFLAGSLLLMPAASLAQGEVYSGGLFELGDAQSPAGFPGVADVNPNSSQLGPDWEDLFRADGSWRDDHPFDAQGNPLGNGIPDYQELHGGDWAVFTADDVSLGTGFEGSALRADGRVENGVAAADHDLGNAYVYLTRDSSGQTVIFAAAERLGGGASHLDIELNQDHFRLGHGGYGTGVPWTVDGQRAVGDLRVRADFGISGLGNVTVSAWDGAGWQALGSTAGEGCNAAESLCALCNAADIDGGPWTNFDTDGDPETLSAHRFLEIGANLGQLAGSTPSFKTVRISTPQDIAFGYFGEDN